MKSQSHDKSMYQPSLFSYANSNMDEELNAAGKTLEEIPHSNYYYAALDRLLDAIEDVLNSGYPLNDELHLRLSNPTLEALIFDEINKCLKLE